jgi:Ca2+-binding RTX toxin-like protein
MCVVLMLKRSAAASFVLLALSSVSDAGARTSCAYSGAPMNLLTVRTTGDAEGVIERLGEQIVVRERRPRPCAGGVPTVLNTDTIRVVMRGLFAGVALRLVGGPFAPGATPEVEGAPEIEVEFSGQGNLGSVVGTPRADELHWAAAGARPGFNLNPSSAGDQDADVTVTNTFTALIAQGAAGNDTIIPAPGAVIPESVSSVGSDGGPGNDRLVAPREHGGILDGEGGNDTITGSGKRDLLYGGTGNDHIAGGGGHDQIIGGPGRDLLSGGRWRDHINARDSTRDRVSCGPGRDFVRADRGDRLRGCERERGLM